MKTTIDKFNFYIGKYKNVIKHILKNLNLKNNFVLLPCSLNDLASASNNKKTKDIYKKIDIATTDGMPIVWYLKNKLNKNVDRVYGPTLMKNIITLTQGKKFKHCLYGSSTKTLKLLKKEVKIFAPKANISLTISPPYRKLTKKEETIYLNKIKKHKINILWIGISSPAQVKLAVKWKNKLPNTSFFCVGAAFDFISKTKPNTPRIFQKSGLEWLFRLATEPKRLWRRYLIIIPTYLVKKIIQKLF